MRWLARGTADADDGLGGRGDGGYIERLAEVRDADGRRLVVRNGQARERTVTCGAGTWQVRAPRVNDKRVDADGAPGAVHQPH